MIVVKQKRGGDGASLTMTAGNLIAARMEEAQTRIADAKKEGMSFPDMTRHLKNLERIDALIKEDRAVSAEVRKRFLVLCEQDVDCAYRNLTDTDLKLIAAGLATNNLDFMPKPAKPEPEPKVKPICWDR